MVDTNTPRDRTKIASDVREMRERIEKEKGTDNIWDMKQARGGLVDIEFTCQFLQLVHASEHPEVLDQNTQNTIRNLRDAGLIDGTAAATLLDTLGLLQALGQVTRLCFEGPFDPQQAPIGLKALLAKVGNEPTFEQLEQKLQDSMSASAAVFEDIIG